MGDKDDNNADKGGNAGTDALKILALPNRGGSNPCPDFLVDL